MTSQRIDLDAYASLPPSEQLILQLLATANGTVTFTKMVAALRKLGVIRGAQGKALNSQSLQDMMKSMHERGWLQAAVSYYVVPPHLANLLTRHAVQTSILDELEGALKIANVELEPSARIRLLLYRNSFAAAYSLAKQTEHHRDKNDLTPLSGFVVNSAAVEDLLAWPDELLALAFEPVVTRCATHLVDQIAPMELLESLVRNGRHGEPLVTLLATMHLLRGHPSKAQECINLVPDGGPDALRITGWICVVQQDVQGALQQFSRAEQHVSALPPSSLVTQLTRLLHLVCLLHAGDGIAARALLRQSPMAQDPEWLQRIHAILDLATQVALQELPPSDRSMEPLFFPMWRRQWPLLEFFRILAAWWVNPDRATELNSVAHEAMRNALLGWPHAHLEVLHHAMRTKEPTPPMLLLDAMRSVAPWQRSLLALERLLETTSTPPPKQDSKPDGPSTSRMAWLLIEEHGHWNIKPVEQVLQAKGKWSKGKPVALQRLYQEQTHMPVLTPADRAVAQCIEAQTYGNYRGYQETTYSFEQPRAFKALVGHPHVFLASHPETPVEVMEGPPVLEVREQGLEVVLQFSPQIRAKEDFTLALESPTRVKLVEIPEHLKPFQQVVDKGIRVPRSELNQVVQLLGPLSKVVQVHSSVGGATQAVEQHAASTSVALDIRPHGTGLKVQAVVRPLGKGGPVLPAGKGTASVLAEMDGKRLAAQRNLAAEQTALQSILEQCPTLRSWPSVAGEWCLDQTEDCLELLSELTAVPDIDTEWPAGQPFLLRGLVSARDMRLTLHHEAQGFRAAGMLRVGPEQEVPLPELLDLLHVSPGRFVQLAPGQFLELTREFHRQLEDLDALAQRHKDRVHLHPLALGALADWVQPGGPFSGDGAWEQHAARIRESQTLTPTLPSTFCGELRGYQEEGFQWMMRLAHWGAGACLADDMGLGKTIQCLAVLLARAANGPALVVAPTSVCPNWLMEALRFAPSLRCTLLGAKDRPSTVNNAGPFDVVVTSYGLMVEEKELLAHREWHTVILDEAQAIKNATTKRAQAAMGLKGAFKIISTGTPVENHALELWTLFHFINPGLLGSLEHFNRRYVTPLEKDPSTLTRLKRLVHPFVLRRTKTAVLPELPEKTEVVRLVELGSEEAALYEALRHRALEKLTGSSVGHVEVLSEIMHLRRVCCHPRLVMPDSPLTSSKLAAFAELVEELRENGHKALVFSQFVDHLTVLREHLDAQGISYQYLDGSTPQAERKKRVDAFQAGVGDLFLISLRAGGQGLNLTAADYVVHMDPWWNPAVEEQASDRAHRMGQTRPVTVYRMVARGTIEERIMALHHKKRVLAESLLEGVDVSTKVSVAELMDLLREQ